MAVSVSQQTYDALSGQRDQYQQIAQQAASDRDSAEQRRLMFERLVSDTEGILADLEVTE